MNYEDFSNAWSAVITRAYNLPAERWVTANDILYFNTSRLEGSSALLPVFDMPNHRNPPADLPKQQTNPSFEIRAEHGYYQFWSDLPYKKGEEYSYMYTPYFFNAHLVEGYGFAVPDNHGDYVDLQIPNLILQMSEKQLKLCRVFGCIDRLYDQFDEYYHIKNENEMLLYRLKHGQTLNMQFLNVHRQASKPS